jgi:hypothetical protein
MAPPEGLRSASKRLAGNPFRREQRVDALIGEFDASPRPTIDPTKMP